MSGVGGRALFSDIYILNKHILKTKHKRLGSKIFCAMLYTIKYKDFYIPLSPNINLYNI